MLTKGLAKLILIGIGVLVVLILIFSSFRNVESGSVGFRKTMGSISDTPLSAGPHPTLPFGFQSIEIVNTKVQKVSATGNAASKDLQIVTAKVTVNYRIPKESAYKLITEVGTDYENTVMHPRIQETLKAVTARYAAEELISKRDKVAAEITDSLTTKLAKYDLAVNNVNIEDFNFSKSFNKAIEQKQTAEQHALKAQNDLKRIQIEAEQKVAEARGEAEANKLKQSTVTPEILKLQQIEVEKIMATSVGKFKGQTLVIGGGVTPTLPVNSNDK